MGCWWSSFNQVKLILSNQPINNNRPYWRSYYPKTNAIIYMIDSSDRARMKTSKDELMLMLEVYLL